jgi:hypothetical protein
MDELAIVCNSCHDEIHNQPEGNISYCTEKVIANKKFYRCLLESIAKYHNDVSKLREVVEELCKQE